MHFVTHFIYKLSNFPSKKTLFTILRTPYPIAQKRKTKQTSFPRFFPMKTLVIKPWILLYFFCCRRKCRSYAQKCIFENFKIFWVQQICICLHLCIVQNETFFVNFNLCSTVLLMCIAYQILMYRIIQFLRGRVLFPNTKKSSICNIMYSYLGCHLVLSPSPENVSFLNDNLCT